MKEALEEAEDTMMDGHNIPIRDDLDDDDDNDDDDLARQVKQSASMSAAQQGYDLTLGENSLPHVSSMHAAEI